MMFRLLYIVHYLAGHTEWRASERGTAFIWRRYTAAGWEYREMTEAESREAVSWWANQI